MTETLDSFDNDSSKIGRPELDSISALARKGVAWTSSFVIFRQVFGVFVTATLARLLVPDDFGLMAMVATLFALIQVFSDLGLSTATVQGENLSSDQSHVLFWVNTAVGVVLAAIVFVVAPLSAEFYGEPRLVGITRWMSITLIFGGLAVQPGALMRRHLLFGKLTIIQFSEYMAGVGVAIGMALAGYGYWALVGQVLATSIIHCITTFGFSRFIPKRLASFLGVGSLLKFGGYLSLTGFFIYLQRNLDNILIGRFLGSQDLAYYTRAYFLMLLPSILATQTLGSVMVPALSAFQNDPERLGSAYRRAVKMIAIVSFPIGAIMLTSSDQIVRIVYGAQWQPVVPILAWMSLLVMTQPIYNTQGWLFTAVGKGRPYFLTMVMVTLLLSIVFVVGVQNGVVSVAALYSIAMSVLVTLPVLYAAHRISSLSFVETLKTLKSPAMAVIAMLFAVLGVQRIDVENPIGSLFLVGTVGTGVYVIILMALDHKVRQSVVPGIQKLLAVRP